MVKSNDKKISGKPLKSKPLTSLSFTNNIDGEGKSDGKFSHGNSIASINGGIPKNPFKKALLAIAASKNANLEPLETDTEAEKFAKRIWNDSYNGEWKAIEFIGKYLIPPAKAEVNLPPLKSDTPKELNESFGILIDHMRRGDLDVDSGGKLMDGLEMRRAFIAAVDFQEDLKEMRRQFEKAQEKRKIEDRERLSQLQQLQELTRAQNVKQTLAGKK